MLISASFFKKDKTEGFVVREWHIIVERLAHLFNANEIENENSVLM